MPLTRLSTLLILSALCAGVALAQSRKNVPDIIVFEGAASVDASSAPAAEELQRPGMAPASDRLASLRHETSSIDSVVPVRHERNFSSDAHSLDSILDAGADRTCLYIRDYRVVRDSPHSDSTHRDGYMTCVPAARFQVYTSVEREH